MWNLINWTFKQLDQCQPVCLEKELFLKTLTVAGQYLVHLVEIIERAKWRSNFLRIATQLLLDLLDDVIAGLTENNVIVTLVSTIWIVIVS